MWGRIAASAALIALAGCAGMESAGRSASRSPEAAPVASAPSAPATAPAPSPAAPPPAAAAAEPPAPAPQADDRPSARASRSGDEEVIVPGVRERQVQPPGDPRSNAERMEDIRAWDQCVMRVQGAFDRDPMRPQLQSPEEYCGESLGMADRLAVPISRLERRR